jgi:hypothetical protein
VSPARDGGVEPGTHFYDRPRRMPKFEWPFLF